jgi:mono/diheme cytochrome c family protein
MGTVGRLTAAAVVALSMGIVPHRPWPALEASSGEAPRAPARLSQTGLFEAGRIDRIDARNRPFSPQYPLWSDGARKSRWVYLPPDATISTSAGADWEFPAGTRFWKEFRFGDRKVETRLLWKATPSSWVAVSYVWNSEQTDAVLAPAAGLPNVAEIVPGRQHTIPSQTDCLACHGSKRTTALGFNLLQLSTDRDPNAIHGEPLEPGMVTLDTLVREWRLSPVPASVLSQPPRIRSRDPLTRAVLGYFAANCGACHNASGEIAALGPSLKFTDLLTDGDGVAARLVGHATSWQVPGVPEGQSVLVDPRTPEHSAMLVRMRSRRPSSQMPPLGTVVRDEAAVAALTRWIAERSKKGATIGSQ